MTMFSPSPVAFRDMAGEWYAFMGIAHQDDEAYHNLLSFAKAPADEAWVYSCVRYRYTSAQGVPLRVYVKDGPDRIPAETTDNRAAQDLQFLLDYVNPVDMTGSSLKAYNVASLSVWGESYVSKVRGTLGGPPQELFWLRAPDMTPMSSDGRSIDTFDHQPPGGEKKSYRSKDIIQFKTVNLENPTRGLPPLMSIRYDIATGHGLSQKSAARIKNNSVPEGYWQVPEEAEFSKQDESLVRRTLRLLRGPKAGGKVPIMPRGLEFKSISLSPQASEAIATGKISRMAVCAALEVPLVLAGDDDKNTVYGNLRDAERVFWRRFIATLDDYADTLNNWLTPDFDPTRRLLTVAFDYSEIEALRPTMQQEWDMWMSGISAQGIVPNEFRRKFKIGPDVPWGDQPTPHTTASIKPPNPPDNLAAEEAVVAPPSPEGEVFGAAPDQTVATLRSFGKDLYRQPAVRAFISGDPLNMSALGLRSDGSRGTIEDGLRRRQSAAQIAARVEALHDD